MSKPKTKPKYDFLSFPIAIIDWSIPGVPFNDNATGKADLNSIHQYHSLIADGYEIDEFAISDGRVYFLFRKK